MTLLLALPLLARSQAVKIHEVKDTVWASQTVTTYMLFPSAIELVDLGTKLYGFRKEGNTLMLKTADTEAPPTSFLIRCEDGTIYQGVIAAAVRPKKNLYTFGEYGAPAGSPPAPLASAGKPPAEASNVPAPELSDVVEVAGEQYSIKKLREYARQLSQRPVQFRSYGEYKDRIEFVLTHMAVHKRVLLVALTLFNKSSVTYKVDYLEFKNATSRRGVALYASQSSGLEPLMTDYPPEVLPNQKSVLLLALPISGINGKTDLVTTVRELDGSRTLEFQVPGGVLLRSANF